MCKRREEDFDAASYPTKLPVFRTRSPYTLDIFGSTNTIFSHSLRTVVRELRMALLGKLHNLRSIRCLVPVEAEDQ